MVLTQHDEKAYPIPIRWDGVILSAAQRNYSITEREMLAITYALRKFHFYIIGTKPHVHTDHQPLIYLLKKMPTIPRLVRQYVLISQYQPRIHSVKKGAICLPDMCSRL